MENQTPEPPAVRRVKLPSGKTIEVLLFDDSPEFAPAQREAEATTQERELHVCPECSRDLVHPVDWSQAAAGKWRVLLHCPNCDRIEEGVFSENVLERFDEALDAGTDTLLSDLRRLARANMEEEVERFVKALHAGFILPEDF